MREMREMLLHCKLTKTAVNDRLNIIIIQGRYY